MAKGDKDRERDLSVNRQAHDTSLRNDELQGSINRQIPVDQANANSEREYLTNRFRGYEATGGIDQSSIDRLRGTNTSAPRSSDSGGSGGSGGSGRVTAPSTPRRSEYHNLTLNDYSDVLSQYGDFAATGGVDLTKSQGIYGNRMGKNAGVDRTQIDETYNDLRDFSKTGGLTEQNRADIQRPTLLEYEKTGGYNDSQLADMRGRSNAAVPGFYNSLKDQLNRRRTSSGGYGSSFDSSTRALTRDSAIESANAARDTELDLGEKVRKGKLDAATQLSDNELRMLGITTPAKIQALEAASESAFGTEKLIADIQLAAAEGDVEAQKIIQSGRLAGLQGTLDTRSQGFHERSTRIGGLQQYGLAQDDIAARDRATRASSSASSAMRDYNDRALTAQNERFLIDSTQRGRQYGDSSGLDLYNSAPAALGQSWNASQNAINSQASANNQYNSILYGTQNQGTPWWQTAANLAGTAANIYGGYRAGQAGSRAGRSAGGYNQPTWV